jgi:hypothetical protein
VSHSAKVQHAYDRALQLRTEQVLDSWNTDPDGYTPYETMFGNIARSIARIELSLAAMRLSPKGTPNGDTEDPQKEDESG